MNNWFVIYMEPSWKKKYIFYIWGTCGPFNNHSDNQCDFFTSLAIWGAQLSSHPYQSTYKIWKQSDKDFINYRENDEVSADAALGWLNHSILPPPPEYIRMGDTTRSSRSPVTLYGPDIHQHSYQRQQPKFTKLKYLVTLTCHGGVKVKMKYLLQIYIVPSVDWYQH